MALPNRAKEKWEPILSNERCPIDHRSLVGDAKICEQCSRATRVKLAEIPVLYIEAGAYLVPGKGGLTGGSSRSTISDGKSWVALGFRSADEILPILEEWERTVRVISLGQVELEGEDRQGEVELNPDGSIKVVVQPRLNEGERPIIRRGTIQERVEGACLFLLAHAQWLTCYEGASEWVEDIAKIHGQGEAATKRFAEKLTRIKCPTSLETFLTEDEIGYENCGAWLTLGENPLDPVECKRCRREWTTLGLVAVILSTPGIEVWLPSESIASILRMKSREITDIVKAHHLRKKGRRGEEFYDLIAVNVARSKAVGDE